MSKLLSCAERRQILDSLVAYLEKHILPEPNEVEIEISQPPVNDLLKEAQDPLGMVHLKPGPDIHVKIHIALGKHKDTPNHRPVRSRVPQ